jgi:hypothetical protein
VTGLKRLIFWACLFSAVAAGATNEGASYASFVQALRAAGLRVETLGPVDQPFFSAKGKVISLSGEHVQVFEYPSAAEAEAQAALVSSNGRSVGAAKPHWLGPPHFFKRGKLIALYLGDDAKTLEALEAELGPQFAGD